MKYSESHLAQSNSSPDISYDSFRTPQKKDSPKLSSNWGPAMFSFDFPKDVPKKTQPAPAGSGP